MNFFILSFIFCLSFHLCAAEDVYHWTADEIPKCEKASSGFFSIFSSAIYPDDTCVEKLGLNYFWSDEQLEQCGIFTKTFDLVKIVDKKFSSSQKVTCSLTTGILSENLKTLNGDVNRIIAHLDSTQAKRCADESGPVTGDDSPNKKYFEELLKKGTGADLNEFLVLWYPERRTTVEDESYFFDCQRAAWKGFKLEGNVIPTSCTPDVLYSWGNKDKLKTLETQLPDKGLWKGVPNPKSMSRGTLYTTVSPSSTFSYGSVQVRLKIRPKTIFAGTVSATGVPGINYIGYRNDYFHFFEDFLVNQSNVIESWSYGTPEQYDEIIRDLQRISSGKKAVKYSTGDPNITQGLHQALNEGVFSYDGYPGDELTLKKRFLTLIEMILKGEGRIYYSEGSCRNREVFFNEGKPTYFRP